MKFENLMATILYVVLLIVIVAVVAQYLVKAPATAVDTSEPAQEFEIKFPEQESQSEEPEFYPAPKQKPDYIRGFIIDPYERPNVKEDIAVAKDAGANLIVITLHLEIGANQTPEIPNELYFDWKTYAIDIINEAHKNGLHTELRTIGVPGTRLAPASDYNNHLSKSKKLFTELAKFADDYQFYQFTLYEQVDSEFNFGSYKTDEVNDAIENITGESIKPYYNGRVGAGFTHERFVKNRDYYEVGDLDYILVSVYPATDTLPSYHPLIKDYIERARLIASTFGVTDVILGGFGVNTDPSPPQYAPLKVTQQVEADFYQEIFDRYENEVEGIIINYDAEMYGIKDHTALEIVSENFNQ